MSVIILTTLNRATAQRWLGSKCKEWKETSQYEHRLRTLATLCSPTSPLTCVSRHVNHRRDNLGSFQDTEKLQGLQSRDGREGRFVGPHFETERRADGEHIDPELKADILPCDDAWRLGSNRI
jgi:hypothetical protein